jgi:hypothetical protein
VIIGLGFYAKLGFLEEKSDFFLLMPAVCRKAGTGFSAGPAQLF